MITIAYSGSLDAYEPSKVKSRFRWFRNLFWTFKNDQVDRSTRSAYYLIKAVRILHEQYGVGPESIRFDFWGLINPLNIRQAEKEGVADFFSFGAYVGKETSLNRIAQADVLFLPLEKTNSSLHRTLFIPGKLFEYLNTGKPVLALMEESDCRTILERSGLGICIEPDQPEAIAKVLFRMVSEKSFLTSIKADQENISSFSFRNKTAELAAVFNEFIVK